MGGLDGYKDDNNTTWALGEEIGREVVRVYRQLSPAPLVGPRFQIETAEILLPRQYRELFEDFTATTVKVPTTLVRIGDLMWDLSRRDVQQHWEAGQSCLAGDLRARRGVHEWLRWLLPGAKGLCRGWV